MHDHVSPCDYELELGDAAGVRVGDLEEALRAASGCTVSEALRIAGDDVVLTVVDNAPSGSDFADGDDVCTAADSYLLDRNDELVVILEIALGGSAYDAVVAMARAHFDALGFRFVEARLGCGDGEHTEDAAVLSLHVPEGLSVGAIAGMAHAARRMIPSEALSAHLPGG